jgi:hypothetical protein
MPGKAHSQAIATHCELSEQDIGKMQQGPYTYIWRDVPGGTCMQWNGS